MGLGLMECLQKTLCLKLVQGITGEHCHKSLELIRQTVEADEKEETAITQIQRKEDENSDAGPGARLIVGATPYTLKDKSKA
ncbi:hypothetical protein PG991_010820 [Apiospora marii]|uniref:Uncharacterized protein n=1 Tax=Apiospora marii TaxID=335849 RepID=A0ABR1RDD1_9PEZI